MRICDNGVYRDATPEEIREWEKLQESVNPGVLSLEQRVSDLEALSDALLGIDT